MPGVRPPVIDPRFGTWNTPIVQALQLSQQRIQQLIAGATQGNLIDAYGNAVEVSGTNLAQVVIIGASHGQSGVQVGTALTGAGRAVQQNLAIGTITTTAGSTSATLNSTVSGTFTNGMVIGAADVSDPTSGLATPAIVPRSTFTISGSSVTLSIKAAESGSAIFCAACNFTQVS